MLKKRLTALLLTAALAVTSFAGCSGGQAASSAASLAVASSTVASSSQPASSESETVSFTDSAGRTVEISKNITKIAPSGALAQVFLYSLCPDKLVGLSGKFSDDAKKYVDQKYWSLPVFGQFYGKNVSLNIEALAAAHPQIIIDIGEKKGTEKEDMDGVQKQTGIPVVFVEATLGSISQAYLTLGDILNEKDQAQKLSDYCKFTLDDAKQKSASIPQDKRVKVYYGLGKDGLQTNPKGSIHADVIDLIGAVNVADIPNTQGSGGNNVSMEQVMKWAPDAIIFDPGSAYGSIGSNKLWKDFAAVKSSRVYEVPIGPYNWMGRPPSINRLLGVKWLGNLLYPDVYKYDMVKEAKDFYQLFYHYSLSDDGAKALMKNSTEK